MRTIEHSVFWRKVRDHLGAEEYAALSKRIHESEDLYKPLKEMWQKWNEQGIPAMIEAASINGCIGEEDLRAQQEELFLAFSDAVGKIQWPLDKTRPLKEEEKRAEPLKEELYPRYEEIVAKFAEAHRCHFDSYSIGSAFHCYCDERK